MWVSPDIHIFYTLKLNNVKTPFSGKIVFLDNHIAVNYVRKPTRDIIVNIFSARFFLFPQGFFLFPQGFFYFHKVIFIYL